MSNVTKNLLVWAALALGAMLVYNVLSSSQGPTNEQVWTYSGFLQEVELGGVQSVVIDGSQVNGVQSGGGTFVVYAPDDPGLVPRLIEAGVSVEASAPKEGISPFFALLINWLPMIVIIGIWIFLMRQMQGAGGRGAMGFGKSRARLLTEKTTPVTFSDVAGIDEVKSELEEIVEYLRNPKKFQRLGGKLPKGVLLVGPPGTGKTLTARAVAGEANVPFFTISGSDFVEMFVGVGASRVRDMFEQGKKSAPCIIFIDELDAVGRHRGAGLGGGNDEREQTLNQLLVEMDGFEATEGVILIAATNRPDVLDPALLRPGRFDRQIVVPNPDLRGREKILKVHARKVPLASDVSLRDVARGTPGFSGADLANLVNEAALRAARLGKRAVTQRVLEEAKDRVMMGAERRSLGMSEDERKLTAYHEAGHALAAIFTEASDPVHKATIVPRGRALGMVMRLPERDHLSYTRDQIEANLVVGLGGRVAEELIFGAGKITTGASNDIQMITGLARRMVTEWGYSDLLSTVRYNENQEEVFLGHSVARSHNVSEKTAETIDEEIRRIIAEADAACRAILTEHLDDLHLLAETLLEYEQLTGDEIKTLLKERKFERSEEPEPTPPPEKGSVPDVSDDELGEPGLASA